MAVKATEGIDLVHYSNPDNEVEASLKVSIAENLPLLSPEKWSDDGWGGDEVLNDHNSARFYSLPSSPIPEIKTAEGRWDFIMNKLINIDNNTTSLRNDFISLSEKVDSHSTQLLQVQSSVADLSDKANLQSFQLVHVKASIASNEKRIAESNKKQESAMVSFDQQMGLKFKAMESSLKQENERFQQVLLCEANKRIQESTEAFQDEKLQGQCEQRRLNLIFVGLPENNSRADLDLVKDFLSDCMSIKDADLTSAYRLGKSGGPKPRPILARFAHLGQRNRVWFSKSSIKQGENKVWLQEDLPKLMKNSYRSLYRVLKKARSLGDRFQGAQIVGQSIIIDGKSYRVEDLETLPDILRPSNLASLQSDKVYVFFRRASPLSNHHHSPFIIDGLSFQCMEQYLAWRRAKLADRQDYIDQALQKADPLVYKAILNDLRPINPEEWNNDLPDTALVGLRAKFAQNPPLAHFLCNTFPKKLGEASPNKKWGVGFHLLHSDVLNSDKWLQGGNLLGETLMVVRDELIAEKNV